jgi:hypothetical protein
MSTPASAVFGTQTPQVEGGPYNVLAFVIQQMLAKVNTCCVVSVIACTNDGDVSAVGTVDVQPLVNQMTGARVAIPHGRIYKLPYSRLQGGANAVILDPEPGDIGIVVFSQRDITNVKNTKKQGNPGSFRQFNWSDGIYVGAILNGTPANYVRVRDESIDVVSTTKVTVTAPIVDVEATTSATVNAPVVKIEGGGTIIDGVAYLPHTHLSATPGDPTGPVIV